MRKVIGPVIVGLLLVGAVALGGCGGSGSDSASEAQLEKARKEGERAARERARVDQLEEEVRNLKRGARRAKANPSSPAAAAAPAPVAQSDPGLLRSFHAPSGNVSCAITSNGAFCSVDSISTTFRVENGEPGSIEPGAALPRGFGELAGYGSTISAGSITCSVPRSDEPRGIVCSDVDSGHGFEASRVSSRQKAY